MNTILEIGRLEIEMPREIKKSISTGGRHIVLLDWDARDDRNVLCFDKSGRKIWQIEAAPDVDGSGSDRWVQIFPLSESLIVGRTTAGFEIEIDLSNGKMVRGSGKDTK
jgi:hypothetical protein